MQFETPVPPFTDALATWLAFLERAGAPTQLLWIDREHVTSQRRRIWLRRGDPSAAARRAAARYEAARARGLGVSLRVVCQVGAACACYVWAPKDETEASYALQPRSLKCQVPVPLLAAEEVRSSIYWHLRRFLNALQPFGNALVAELPPAGG
jgi:hypothetical protein